MLLKYETVPGIEPSFAERHLAKKLSEVNVVFAQEVVFENCKNPITGLHLRFDFYLPAENILIEYDSIEFHADAETKARDRIKTYFAKTNGIKLVRIQGISNIDYWILKKFGNKVIEVKSKISNLQKHMEDRSVRWFKNNKSKNQKRKYNIENAVPLKIKSQTEIRQAIKNAKFK